MLALSRSRRCAFAIAISFGLIGTSAAWADTTPTQTPDAHAAGESHEDASVHVAEDTPLATQAVSATPPTPTGLPSGVEALAKYVAANSCDATPKPGTVAFAEMLRTNSGVGYGIARACGADSLSTTEHYDGRAVDWSVTIRDAAKYAKATEILNWLFAKDANGNQYANLRRLGIMYIIWNNKIWGAYRPADGWVEYNGCSTKTSTAYDTTCHRDHIHFSLSWEGANKHTSWWTKTVAQPEYGPCRVPDLNWAPPTTAVRYTACPSYAKVAPDSAATANGKALVNYSGMYIKQGSTGPVVKAVQAEIGTPADSDFGPATLTALKNWQIRKGISATGVMDAITWRAMIKPYLPGATPPPPTPPPTVAGVKSDGSLWTYLSNGRGSLTGATSVGTGWGGYKWLFAGGDSNGDRRTDLLAVNAAGDMLLRRALSTGGYDAATKIGNGWSSFRIVAPGGDLTGDGYDDVLTVASDGRLRIYPTKGSSWGSIITLGQGWEAYNRLASVEDLNGDRKNDIIAATPGGTLYFYAGLGNGTFAPRVVIGGGWQVYTALLGIGDGNGDGRPDLMARASDGLLYFYAGIGGGKFATRVQLGPGWQVFNPLLDVH